MVKAVTPDLDAQGIGGTVNLITQSPFDFKQPLFAQGSAQYGAQQFNDRAPVPGRRDGGRAAGLQPRIRRGGGRQLASDREFRTYGMYPDDWRPVPQVARGLPTNLKYNTYELHRKRLGAERRQPSTGRRTTTRSMCVASTAR